jgi:hypothetical protein
LFAAETLAAVGGISRCVGPRGTDIARGDEHLKSLAIVVQQSAVIPVFLWPTSAQLSPPLGSYMLLAVALERLQDPDNARAACERALQLDPREPLVHLNCGARTWQYDHGGTETEGGRRGSTRRADACDLPCKQGAAFPCAPFDPSLLLARSCAARPSPPPAPRCPATQL